MASDVKKTVEIALKIVGVDLDKLKTISTAFENIQKAADNATKSLKKFNDEFKKIKTPIGLGKVITSLTELSKLKMPNLNNIAIGFKKLGEMKSVPDLSKFVPELKKLEGIDIPKVNSLATGLKNLMAINFSGFSKKIATIEKGLRKLADINLDKLTETLKHLNTLNLKKAAAELRSLNEAMKKTGTTAQTTGLRLRTFSDKVKTVLEFRLISDALVALKRLIINGIGAIIDYSQSLKDLQAITGATTLEVAQMGSKILEVASTTKFSASEVAQGMRVIGQAGFTATEAVETMQSVANLATGTLSSMATTVDLVTTAMRVFQIDASRSTEVSDVFANAVNRSKLTIDKLRTAMNYVGPIARDSGVSFKELAASMGTLANSGLRASTIGTGLRRVFAELVDPSKKLKAAIKDSGVAIEELDPRANSLSSVLSNLSIVVDDAAIAFDVFGKRGASAVLALTNEQSGFDSMLATVSESGTAAWQASIQMEGLGVSFKNMRDKAGILAIAIGESGLNKAMKLFVDTVRLMIDGLTYFVNTTVGQVVTGFGLITAAVLPLVGAFVKLKIAAVFSSIVASVQLMAAEFASFAILAETTIVGLAATIGAVLAPIAAVIAGISLLVWWLGKAKKAAEETAKLSDQYQSLSKSMQDYSVKVASIAKNTKEFTDANKALRTSLLQTADAYSDVSTEALAAALSIDPLTGKIKEGSTAIDLYNKKLEEVAKNKLVMAANAANDSFDQLRLPLAELDEFGVAADSVGAQFKLMKTYVAHLDEKLGNLSRNDQKIILEFHAMEEMAGKVLVNMQKLGKVNLDDTVQNFTRLAKAEGYSGEVLGAIIDQFKELKEINSKTPKNLIEKWSEDGTDSLSELFKEYENLSNEFGEGKGIFGVDEQGVSEKSIIIQTEAAKKSLKIKYDALNAETAALIANGKDEEAMWRRHQEKMNILDAEAADIRITLSKNVAYQNLVILASEKEKLKKKLDENAILYKNNAKERVRIEDEANAAFARSREQLRVGSPIDIDAQESQYKSLLDSMKVDLQKHLHEVALAEAQGVITSEQAQAQKAQIELKYYKDREVSAKEYFNLIANVEKAGEENYDKRLKLVKDAEAKNYKERADNLVEFNKAITSANDDLSKLDKDYANEKQKHAQKLEEIENKTTKKLEKINFDYSIKRTNIEKKLQDKLEALRKNRLQNEKDDIQTRYDLEKSSEDAIRGIREKGMSEEAAQASKQAAALQKLTEGRRLLNEYYLWGDPADLANGKKLLDQSLGMVDAFNDQTSAIKLVNDATELLKKASGYDKELKDLEVLKKEKEAQAKADNERIAAKKLYDEKLKNAVTVINEIAKKEDIRHKKEMQNQLDELQLYKLKVAEAEKLVRLSGGTVSSSTSSSNLLQAEKEETVLLLKKLSLLGKIKNVKEETDKIDRTIVESEDVNGVKTFTETLLRANKETEDSYTKLKESGVDAFVQISQEVSKTADSIDESLDENNVKTFTDLGKKVAESFEQIEEPLTNLQEVTNLTFQEMSNSIRGTSDALLELAQVNDTDLSGYEKVINKISKLKDELLSIIAINKIFDIVAKVIGYEDVVDLQKAIDKLKDKTITITTRYTSQGSSPSGYASGGRLPGFGGGDRRPILAEDGEWIINKFAVRKFGDSFLSSINNMTLPKFQNGGKVALSNVATTGTSILNSLANFGTVSLDTGTAQIPAIVQRDVITELTTHLQTLRRFQT